MNMSTQQHYPIVVCTLTEWFTWYQTCRDVHTRVLVVLLEVAMNFNFACAYIVNQSFSEFTKGCQNIMLFLLRSSLTNGRDVNLMKLCPCF